LRGRAGLTGATAHTMIPESPSPPLILASTSRYRQALLARLGVAFETVPPQVDEARIPGEEPQELVRRLAEAKARAVGARAMALVIGSDQVATCRGEVLGKPGAHAPAQAQLRRLSGSCVTFLTGLCLFNSARGSLQLDIVPFRVHFRDLDEGQIDRYLRQDRPYDCAGSFKSEGLGITLFKRMEGDDPTALVGLPLIRLTDMLTNEGLLLP
jgi:septum formation protein